MKTLSISLLMGILLLPNGVQAGETIKFTEDFRISECTFNSSGKNPFFNLTPGFKATFKGEEQDEKLDLTITVLNETKTIQIPDVGTIEARIIEERELENDRLTEISKNYFAICDKTNDVFYFGEEVDIYEEDGTITHEGAWEAGVAGAKPGIIMPGTFLLGSRYFQEQAADVALDRAEHIADNYKITTEAGTFENCVRITETSPLEPGHESKKVYCPDVGLVQDDVLELIKTESPE